MRRDKTKPKQNRRERREITGKVRQEKYIDERYLAPPVQAKNAVQRDFIRALNLKQVVVFSAPAGVGKSFITMSVVTDWLKKGDFDSVKLTRPATGMGKTLGLLPGNLEEKYTPYLLPLIDVIRNRYGSGFYESSIHNKTIEMVPLEYIRGRSFSDVVVLDEAQNTTPDEMYTILTRVEEEGKLIIIGDPTQNDMRGQNGIDWLCDFIYDNPELESEVAIIKASSEDIVRSGLCKKVVQAKERSMRHRNY